MKILKPKKLTLHEMWSLYALLADKENTEQLYLIDSIISILHRISASDFTRSMRTLYGNKKAPNGLVAAEMFSVGLKQNQFFEFAGVIKALKHNG